MEILKQHLIFIDKKRFLTLFVSIIIISSSTLFLLINSSLNHEIITLNQLREMEDSDSSYINIVTDIENENNMGIEDRTTTFLDFQSNDNYIAFGYQIEGLKRLMLYNQLTEESDFVFYGQYSSFLLTQSTLIVMWENDIYYWKSLQQLNQYEIFANDYKIGLDTLPLSKTTHFLEQENIIVSKSLDELYRHQLILLNLTDKQVQTIQLEASPRNYYISNDFQKLLYSTNEGLIYENFLENSTNYVTGYYDELLYVQETDLIFASMIPNYLVSFDTDQLNLHDSFGLHVNDQDFVESVFEYNIETHSIIYAMKTDEYISEYRSSVTLVVLNNDLTLQEEVYQTETTDYKNVLISCSWIGSDYIGVLSQDEFRKINFQ